MAFLRKTYFDFESYGPIEPFDINAITNTMIRCLPSGEKAGNWIVWEARLEDEHSHFISRERDIEGKLPNLIVEDTREFLSDIPYNMLYNDDNPVEGLDTYIKSAANVCYKWIVAAAADLNPFTALAGSENFAQRGPTSRPSIDAEMMGLARIQLSTLMMTAEMIAKQMASDYGRPTDQHWPRFGERWSMETNGRLVGEDSAEESEIWTARVKDNWTPDEDWLPEATDYQADTEEAAMQTAKAAMERQDVLDRINKKEDN